MERLRYLSDDSCRLGKALTVEGRRAILPRIDILSLPVDGNGILVELI